MALVIENGSLVAGATSFVTVEEVRAYAAARASAVPAVGEAGDAAIEAACIAAMDFIENLRDQFQGSKVNPETQELQFPRSGVVVDGYSVPADSIPKVLKSAQCALALEAVNGTDLMPTGDGAEVVREKVDVLETEYAPGSNSNPQPVLTKAMALLRPLLKNFGGLTVSRA